MDTFLEERWEEEWEILFTMEYSVEWAFSFFLFVTPVWIVKEILQFLATLMPLLH